MENEEKTVKTKKTKFRKITKHPYALCGGFCGPGAGFGGPGSGFFSLSSSSGLPLLLLSLKPPPGPPKLAPGPQKPPHRA